MRPVGASLLHCSLTRRSGGGGGQRKAKEDERIGRERDEGEGGHERL